MVTSDTGQRQGVTIVDGALYSQHVLAVRCVRQIIHCSITGQEMPGELKMTEPTVAKQSRFKEASSNYPAWRRC